MNAPTVIILLVLVAAVVCTVVSYRKKVASGCCGAGGDKVFRVTKQGSPADYPHHKVAMIDGMHCENCAARVANAFNQEDGLMAEVSLPKKRVDVYSSEPLDDGRIRQLVARAGYMVIDMREA